MVERPGGAGARERLPRWFGVLVHVMLVLSVALNVANYVHRKGRAAALKAEMSRLEGKMQDGRDLWVIAGALAATLADKRPAPLDAERRLDVYALLRGRPDDEIVRVCFSEWTGKGPSLEEIRAGDYTNFPYQRRRGGTWPPDDAPAPVVWEQEPFHGWWTVVLAHGEWSLWEEPRMREFFRENPGQE